MHPHQRIIRILLLIFGVVFVSHTSYAIPAFSRMYGTSCSTCHIDFPKQNDFGKAFKDAGFKFPKDDESFITEGSGGSRYKLAADAFDDHISHLIRPTLAYFKDDPKQEPKFDGISFSTTVRLLGKNQAGTSGEAVEFFFPFAALRCYEKFDCTGQQLLDAGSVLINGERVSLDLQIAEGVGH